MALLIEARRYLERTLGGKQIDRLKRIQAQRFRWLQYLIGRLLFGSNLKALAVINNTDKWGSHWYAGHYETHFAGLRRKRINLLEIGIGGYDDPGLGGGSLRMWRTYFPKGRIYGVDIYDKSLHNERRIKTFKGSQADEGFLLHVIGSIGHVDIIIDDGSHLNEHVLRTFAILFPRLGENGVYVIEDTQTSYWPEYGGSSNDLDRADTVMGFLKKLADGLNYAEFKRSGYQPTYYDKHIVSMHFYHNIVFIQKGSNVERSNFLDPAESRKQ